MNQLGIFSYLLQQVLHSWGTEDAGNIVSCCHGVPVDPASGAPAMHTATACGRGGGRRALGSWRWCPRIGQWIPVFCAGRLGAFPRGGTAPHRGEGVTPKLLLCGIQHGFLNVSVHAPQSIVATWDAFEIAESQVLVSHHLLHHGRIPGDFESLPHYIWVVQEVTDFWVSLNQLLHLRIGHNELPHQVRIRKHALNKGIFHDLDHHLRGSHELLLHVVLKLSEGGRVQTQAAKASKSSQGPRRERIAICDSRRGVTPGTRGRRWRWRGRGGGGRGRASSCGSARLRGGLALRAVLDFDDKVNSQSIMDAMLDQGILIFQDFSGKNQHELIGLRFEAFGNRFLKLLDGAILGHRELLLLFGGLHSDFDDFGLGRRSGRAWGRSRATGGARGAAALAVLSHGGRGDAGWQGRRWRARGREGRRKEGGAAAADWAAPRAARNTVPQR